ncbi:U3 snoRNP protein, partial [Linnemannia exigua]
DDTIPNPDKDKDICAYILDLLRQIDDLPDSPVSTHAQSQLQGLETEGSAVKQNLYRDIMAGPFNLLPLKVRLSGPSSSTLLDRVQAAPEVDRTLYKLRTMRLEESANALYIPPQAKPTSRSGDDKLFQLMDYTLNCLASGCQVLLLLGDSGGGKSTFNLQLERTLWQSYKRGDPIPLHINLATIDDPQQNMIAKRLRQLDFSEAQIQELKQQRELIVICDGYDEGQLKRNLYTSNLFNEPRQWNVKLVITCRIQYLGPDYRSQFLPITERYQQQQQQQAADRFQELFIAPFSGDQIKEYVEQYVARAPQHTAIPDQQKWSADDYMDKLLKINGLMELVSNPFLLTLALRALPKAVQSEKDISKIRLTRVGLYDIFMEQWLESNKFRLQDSRLPSEAQATFYTLCDAGFIQEGINYQKDLAAAIFQHQGGKPVVDYVHKRESDSWKAAFFGPTPEAVLLRESSPLARSGNQYRFLHRSLLEYLYSRLISDLFDLGDNPTEDNSEAASPRNILANHLLNQRNIAGERSILQFLAERVDSNQSFKTFLLDAVEASKVDDGVSIAAANAISILVKAGVRFNGADLRRVKIPGALLQGGQFDSADLREADLFGANLSKAWLRKANMRGARMEGIEFEQSPYLQIDSGIKNCVFSSDGKLLFVCSHQCSVDVYNTETWEMKDYLIGKSAIAISPCGKEFANATLYNNADVVSVEAGEVEIVLSGHEDSIESVCYSPDGSLIATGSKDKSVRIWRLADFDIYVTDGTGNTVGAFRILRGHDHTVTGVAFSPSGLRFASCSMDKTIRIINIKTWSLISTLDCAAPVLAFAYSPDGQQLASCGQDADLRLWNTDSGNTDHLLKGHVGTVFDVAYSPDGRRVGSCGSDGVVRLWNSDSGKLFDSLPGDRYEANCIAFSPTDNLVVSGGRGTRLQMWKTGDEPSANTFNNGLVSRVYCVDISMNGEQIATGCFGGAVQLWETLTGNQGVMLEGHKSDVIGVVFSPNGEHVASNSADKTMRLSCASTGKSQFVFEGQKKFGKGLAFAPDGTRLVTSYDQDPTIQLWDIKSGEMVATLPGHTDEIGGIIYSPTGDQIASWSDDKTIRLWSTWTNKCLHTLNHKDAVLHVAYSPDGQQLISATGGGSSWWDVNTGEFIELFWRAIDPVIFWCSYSSDGKYLATRPAVKKERRLSARELGPPCSTCGGDAAPMGRWSLRVRELTEDVGYQGGKGSYSGVQLMWSVGEDELTMEDAILDSLDGVSAPNCKLMRQRVDGVDKVAWSEGSTEKYFRKWGYFESEEEEEWENPAKRREDREKEEKKEKKKEEKKIEFTGKLQLS